ncbi:hypothetical protein GUK70_03505 [Stenotrophomonas maltophilia]|nr:hypothetical protein [Stenotrophomonas maltophilia]
MKSLDEYLDSYLDGSSDPGTAVMLIGHWGSGKTHYIQGYFRRRAEQSAASEALLNSTPRKWWHLPFLKSDSRVKPAATSPTQHLYASFFGADSAAAISDQFLSQLYPVLNSTLGKVLGAAAIRVSNIGVQVATAGAVADAAREEDAKAITRWLSNPKGRVLVFDDLERAGMPIEMCLSIINSYVERDGLKVIVLANDAEINADSVYGRWKEKAIGKTVKVISDPGAVLDSLLLELDEGPVKTAVKDERAALLAVMEVSKLVNYRSVRSLVFDAQRLLKLLDRRLRDSKAGVLELLKFSIALGGELRAGRLEPEEVEIVQQCFAIRVKDKSKRTERDLYILDLEERFASVLALESVVPASGLVSFWRVGTLDVEAANAAIQQNALVVGVQAQPPWQRLWELRRLSISRYNEARVDLLKSIDQRMLYVQGEILHVVGIALTLEDFGVGLFPQFKEVNLWVQQYASDPVVFDRLERSVGWLDGADSYAGLGFHKRRDPRFMRAFELLEELVDRAEQKRLLADVPVLLAQIRNRDYSNIYSFGAPGSVDGKPWLHLVGSGELADLLLHDGVMQSPLLSLLIKRYSEDSLAKLRLEWRSLRLLRETLRQRIRHLPDPFRAIATETVSDASSSLRKGLAQAINITRRHENRVLRRKSPA